MPQKPAIAFQYLTNDLVLLDIYAYSDADSLLLEGYTSHIVTPVCEDSLCYEAELDFYWDRLGNFTKFSLKPDNPLTKLDHIPFTQSDYDQLMKILLIKSPSFVYMKRNQLVEKSDAGIDGITSATLTQVKEDMVAGAIYTCYTLWHIANGEIMFKIKEHTKGKLNERLIRKFLRSKNVEEHYFIIEHIDPKYYQMFLPEILSLAEKHQGYFTQRVIEKIPISLMKKPLVQDFFSTNYHQLEYPSQSSLLKKLADVPLQTSTLDVLVEDIHPANPLQNEQIIRLVIKHTAAENMEVLMKMLDILSSHQIVVSEELYQELIPLSDQYKPLRKEMRKFRRAQALATKASRALRKH